MCKYKFTVKELDIQKELISISRRKVLKCLMQKSPQTWSQLLQSTGISSRTLQKTLKRLISEGLIERKIGSSEKYPPPVFYSLTKKSVEALTPILFHLKARPYVFGYKICEWKKDEDGTIRQVIENMLYCLPIKERMETIASRYLAYYLFSLLQWRKTRNDDWLVKGEFLPEILLQLELGLHGEIKMQNIAQYKGDLIMKITEAEYEIPAEDLEEIMKSAFPNEYCEFQNIVDEILKNAKRVKL